MIFTIAPIMTALNSSMNEHFASDEKAEQHYDKHVVDGDRGEFPSTLYPNTKLYVKGGDRLANTPVAGSDLDSGDVVGFKSAQHGGCYIKYDKRHHTMVVYKPDPSKPCGVLIFTYHKYRNSDARYERMKAEDMIGEIEG